MSFFSTVTGIIGGVLPAACTTIGGSAVGQKIGEYLELSPNNRVRVTTAGAALSGLALIVAMGSSPFQRGVKVMFIAFPIIASSCLAAKKVTITAQRLEGKTFQISLSKLQTTVPSIVGTVSGVAAYLAGSMLHPVVGYAAGTIVANLVTGVMTKEIEQSRSE